MTPEILTNGQNQDLDGVLSSLQSPEQVLDLVQNPHMKELMFLIAASQGIVKAPSHPDWVLGAMREFWRSCLDIPRSKQAKSEAFRLGFLCGMVSRAKPEWFGSEAKLLEFFAKGRVMNLIHESVREVPVSEASTFYAGFSEGILRSESISPSTPCLFYLVVAIAWRRAEQCRNVRELQSWLDEVIGRNLTGNRDRIAKLCQKIRFPFTDKGGRPRAKPRIGPAS